VPIVYRISKIGIPPPLPFPGTLKEVALAGCKAREDAAVAVLKAVNKNNSLSLLDIRGVPLGPEVSGETGEINKQTGEINNLLEGIFLET